MGLSRRLLGERGDHGSHQESCSDPSLLFSVIRGEGELPHELLAHCTAKHDSKSIASEGNLGVIPAIAARSARHAGAVAQSLLAALDHT